MSKSKANLYLENLKVHFSFILIRSLVATNSIGQPKEKQEGWAIHELLLFKQCQLTLDFNSEFALIQHDQISGFKLAEKSSEVIFHPIKRDRYKEQQQSNTYNNNFK